MDHFRSGAPRGRSAGQAVGVPLQDGDDSGADVLPEVRRMRADVGRRTRRRRPCCGARDTQTKPLARSMTMLVSDRPWREDAEVLSEKGQEQVRILARPPSRRRCTSLVEARDEAIHYETADPNVLV